MLISNFRMKPFAVALYMVCTTCLIFAFPEQGKWKFSVNQDHEMSGVIKGIYANTNIYIRVLCDAPNKGTDISISYVIRRMRCYQETLDPKNQDLMAQLHEHPEDPFAGETNELPIFFFPSHELPFVCDHSIVLMSETQPLKSQTPWPREDFTSTVPVTAGLSTQTVEDSKNDNKTQSSKERVRRSVESVDATSKTLVEVINSNATSDKKIKANSKPQYVIAQEGIFMITIRVAAMTKGQNFSAEVELEIQGYSGYLSAVDWPLLPFYGSMCVVYFIFGVAWLVVLALQWRDLLRIQFWIGGVIFLGMIEKAVFYAEYQSVNSTGVSVQGAVLVAEIVSCLKRTLARMLVIIVSLGFGIVKPRLGPMLHRVVGVGGLYFLLCSLEAFLRIMRVKNDHPRTLMLAEVPLAILDTAICWWIFSNLVQTTRTLRLRRNIVKLSLYRHFTNTLIFACIASVAFMIWVYRAHNLPICVTDWKELWVDDAYWHLLFSVILLVIMVLWRPTNNNQRYAFTPLIDAADDEDEDTIMNDAYDGMKMRGMKNQNLTGTAKEKEPLKKMDEDLTWVEENIPPTIADSTLPSLLDSDEEIMNTKFEMSKME